MDTETVNDLISARNTLQTLAEALHNLAELAGDGADTLADILDTEAPEAEAWRKLRRPPLEPLPDEAARH